MALVTYTEPLKKQYQLEYVFYMMFSSYFKKVECSTKNSEKSLLLYYKEAGQKTQFEYEDNILWAIENVILPKLGNPCFDEDEVTFRITKEPNRKHVFEIVGKDFTLIIRMNLEGSKLSYVIEIFGKDRFENLHQKKIRCFSTLKKGKNEQQEKKKEEKETLAEEIDSDFEDE